MSKNDTDSQRQVAIKDDQYLDSEAVVPNQPVQRALVEPFSLTEEPTRAIDCQYALNPLIGTATPMISVINQIQMQNQQAFDPDALYQSLIQEIKLFEAKARKLHYRSAIILAARYFLCAFIDEVIQSCDPHIQQQWQQHPLLQSMQGETWGGERYFMILERASEDAKEHIDILELGYLCLQLGYQGKYREPGANPRELEQIKDNLLSLIEETRPAPNAALFLDNHQGIPAPILTQKSKFRLPHIAIATGLMLAGLVGVYLSYHIHLNNMVRPVAAILNTMDNQHD